MNSNTMGFMLVHFVDGNKIVFHDVSYEEADFWTDLVSGEDADDFYGLDEPALRAINTDKTLAIEWTAY